MIVIGIDAHKCSHTAVAIDASGRKLGQKTTGTTSGDHLELLRWAESLGPDRSWAVEDCRHLSRRLETDMIAAGQRIVRVPPKLMAHARDSARSYGKSDPIDALAVARAALREPNLPVARLDGQERELRLLVDHREDLVAEATRIINRLRWHLDELDPAKDIPIKSLDRYKSLDELSAWLTAFDGNVVARIAGEQIEDLRRLVQRDKALEKEIGQIVDELVPTLRAIDGVGALTAAKIVGETASIDRFSSKDAFAAHNGTAPMPVWSGNSNRHRLRRTGNRQLNCAIHRIAVTQIRVNSDAKAFLERRMANGDTKMEALRALKRRLSDVVYRALLADSAAPDASLPVAA